MSLERPDSPIHSEKSDNRWKRVMQIAGKTAIAGMVLTGKVGAEKNPTSVETPSHHNSAEDHEHEAHKLWAKQQAQYDEMANRGAQGVYNWMGRDKQTGTFYSKEKLEAGRCWCCSDEGNTNYKDMALLRTPGSGMLEALKRSDCDPFAPEVIKAVATQARAQNVKVFTGHAGCGAAKIIWSNHLRAIGKTAEADALSDADVQKFNETWMKEVVSEMQRQDPDHAAEYQSDFITKLDRPAHLHDARMIVVDKTGAFDSKTQGLPKAFVETVTSDIEAALNEAAPLVGIAFGDHGFGKNFTEKPTEQLVVCCVADTPAERDTMIKTAQDFVAKHKEWNGRVRVEGIARGQ